MLVETHDVKCVKIADRQVKSFFKKKSTLQTPNI